MAAEPAIPFLFLFLGGWAVFLFLVADHVCKARLADRLRQVAPQEWQRLGSPAPALIPLPFPIARETQGLIALARLTLWATFTRHHVKFADAELSRRAWIVRLMTLVLLALVAALLSHLPLAPPR